MNEEETRQFREACEALVSGWEAWTDALRAAPRAGEEGYLPFDTAWECARIEYVLDRWRTTACNRAEEIVEIRKALDTYEGANRELSKDREALRSLLVEVLSFFPAPHWTKGRTDGLVNSGSVLWSTLAKWRATVAEPGDEGPDVYTVYTVTSDGRQAWLVCKRSDGVTVGRIERVRPDGFRAFVDVVTTDPIGGCVGWSADMAGALRVIRRNLG